MRRLFILCVLLLIFFSVEAQQDDKAIEILDEVNQKTSSFETILANFSFSMENEEMDIDEQYEGTIKLKGQKYNYTIPEQGMTVFSDGTTLWNYMTDGNQVTISDVESDDEDLMNPSSLLSIYKKGFQSKFISEKKVGDKTVYIIELYPDDEFQDFSKIELAINKSTMMLDSATIYGTDDNLYSIDIENVITDSPIADSEFAFDPSKYNDIEIIDFR